MTLERNEYGLIEYEEKVQEYTWEEIEEENRINNEREEAALAGIEADGFVRFPVFFTDYTTGELVEAYSYVPPTFTPSCSENFKEIHGMDYNIYIPSYGRAGSTKTDGIMKLFGLKNWYLAIDPSQYESYKEHYPMEHIIIRDPSFRSYEKLDLMSSIPSPDTMHGTAGIYNFLLYFSRTMGETHYWTMDDDIKGMAMKAHKGDKKADLKIPYNKENFFRCSQLKPEYGFQLNKFLHSLEDLQNKSRNPGFVGLEKFGLIFDLPIMWKFGTRLYSFYLTDNTIQIDHFGQHNNDVITSLELNKRGFVNLLFEGVSYDSLATQQGGGLTEVYKKFGTLDKGKVLVRGFPANAKISNTFNRIHHNVNYHYYTKQRIVGKEIKK